ncbi:hypothetical protein CROQUDRAFT_66042 [Cronartium quercuum f. sp. fusiforme G11]|uniref:Uracil-DNA glycosylase n=1 Tax=Cronartium quercuum f. sp. fusiforme G11 TaxID=708437 RepID=A0A9P6T915_9BASI|nr:hypothetical protein CROQUDRAFT_66042 [Cronartium quercuum f. sp. fusiforme G11]
MSVPKPGEKRQRSIADMFGVPKSAAPKLTAPATTNASSKAKSTAKKPLPSNSKNSVARIAYHRLPVLDPQTVLAGLPEDHRELLELELNPVTGLGPSYLRTLRSELTRTYFLDLKRFLRTETSTPVYPAASDIYSWSRRTPLTGIKVVIIGQDPYHGPGQAHGLSFSVPRGVAIPGSLRNIHEELKREYEDFKKPTHGSLGSWADAGVLLLNTSLTVRKGEAGSHAGRGWEQFTDAVVDAIDLYGGLELGAGNIIDPNDDEGPSTKRQKTEDESSVPVAERAQPGFGKGVVFLCWGKWAADRVARLSDTKHLILRSAHPSPLSAHRGFIGNGHFKRANEWLATRYGPSAVVDWCSLKPDNPPNPIATKPLPKETEAEAGSAS